MDQRKRAQKRIMFGKYLTSDFAELSLAPFKTPILDKVFASFHLSGEVGVAPEKRVRCLRSFGRLVVAV